MSDRAGGQLAEIVETKGDEAFWPVEFGDWREAVEAQSLINGDGVRTGPFGGLALAFEDRTQVRLHANSRMTLGRDSSGKKSVFNLQLGRIWSRASKPDAPIVVTSPSATAAIRGTDWFMEVAEDGSSHLVVLNGEVRFFNDLGSVDVPAGASAIARVAEAPELELVVTTQDRPRWALTPRSDWARLLPYEPMIDKAVLDGHEELAQAWRIAVSGRVREASVLVDGMAQSPSLDVLKALNALRQRDIGAAEAALASDFTADADARLASLLRIGAAVDRADLGRAAKRLEADKVQWGEDDGHMIMAAWLEAYAGRYGEATELAQRLAEARPDSVSAALLLAQTAALTGDDALFGAQVDRALDLAPERDDVWHWVGIYRLLTGGDAGEGARQAFAHEVTLNPEAVSAFAGLAALDTLEGRYATALVKYDQALALDAREPFALAGKTYALIQMDRLDLAEALITPALEDQPTHPEILSARALLTLLQADAETASRAAGKVIAANPGRPGVNEMDAVSHWHAGRRDVAMKVVSNAVRLDPNSPSTALIASIMSQDQYQSGKAVEFARTAWLARTRNQDAGLITLPASQNGRLDIGGAFRNLGLVAQGDYYTSLAATQYDANSAFAQAVRFGAGQASQSSTAIGLMLDPLSVSYPNRHAQFVLEERHEKTIGLEVGAGEGGALNGAGFVDINGIYRPGAHPIAYAGYFSASGEDGELDNDQQDSLLVSLRAGARMNGRDAFLFRTTLNRNDAQLPGSRLNPDFDDQNDTESAIFELGYSRSNAWNDRWMLRATGGFTERRFSNPSAPGATVSDLDYSLIHAFGLSGAQAAAARGLYDTALSDPSGYIWVYAPFGEVPVTDRLGQSLLPYRDDDDTVRRIQADERVLSLQSRRLFALGDWDFSLGAEYGLRENEATFTEAVFYLDNAAVLFDLTIPDGVQVIDTGRLEDLSYDQDTTLEEYRAHAFARWNVNRNLLLEAGLFGSDYRSKIVSPAFNLSSRSHDEHWDPRLGLSWRGDDYQFRFVHQTQRALAGVDTIAPVAVMALSPSAAAGGGADSVTSTLARLDFEVSDKVFFSIEGEQQALDFVAAARPKERQESNLFFADEADVTRLFVTGNWQVMDCLGLSLGVEALDHVIRGGSFDGEDIPLTPDIRASAGASWVDPRFFRVDAHLDYLSERSGLLGGVYKLDPSVVASVSAMRESRDKAWRMGAIVSGVLSDVQEIAPGVEESQASFRISLAHRW